MDCYSSANLTDLEPSIAIPSCQPIVGGCYLLLFELSCNEPRAYSPHIRFDAWVCVDSFGGTSASSDSSLDFNCSLPTVLLLSKSSSKFVRNDDGDDDFDADSDCRLIRGGKTTNARQHSNAVIETTMIIRLLDTNDHPLNGGKLSGSRRPPPQIKNKRILFFFTKRKLVRSPAPTFERCLPHLPKRTLPSRVRNTH